FRKLLGDPRDPGDLFDRRRAQRPHAAEPLQQRVPPRGADPGHLQQFARQGAPRSEEHTSELQSRENLVCRLLLEKKNTEKKHTNVYSTFNQHMHFYLVLLSIGYRFSFSNLWRLRYVIGGCAVLVGLVDVDFALIL